MSEEDEPRLSLKERMALFEPPQSTSKAVSPTRRRPLPPPTLPWTTTTTTPSSSSSGAAITTSNTGNSISSKPASIHSQSDSASSSTSPLRLPVKDIVSLYGSSPVSSTIATAMDPLSSHYPPLSPTPSSGSAAAKSRSASPIPSPLNEPVGLDAFSDKLRPRPRATSSASVASSNGGGGSASGQLSPEIRPRTMERAAVGNLRGGSPVSVRSTSSQGIAVRKDGVTLQQIKIPTTQASTDSEPLISLVSPIRHSPSSTGSPSGGGSPSRLWGTANADSPSWRLQPPTPVSRRPASLERNHSGPVVTRQLSGQGVPALPPRRAATTASEPNQGSGPVIPPRPTALSSSPETLRTPSLNSSSSAPPTPPIRHSRHSRKEPSSEFESISLSSDGASALAKSLSSSTSSHSLTSTSSLHLPPPIPPNRPRATSSGSGPGPTARVPPWSTSPSRTRSSTLPPSRSNSKPNFDSNPAPTSITPSSPKEKPPRRPMDPHSKSRYDTLFDKCVDKLNGVGVDGSTTKPAWIKRDEKTTLDALVVKGVWERSRLESEVLGGIWNECDEERKGSLRKAEFSRGLWLIDEELRRRSRRLV
ncbi:hypothetical protein T439DRAFT_375799 [Meredithblackwellia eburnea MCA 4105]